MLVSTSNLSGHVRTFSTGRFSTAEDDRVTIPCHGNTRIRITSLYAIGDTSLLNKIGDMETQRNAERNGPVLFGQANFGPPPSGSPVSSADLACMFVT
ncbi:unnamed protein product [Echinostoma caproni]|uniref:Uncharacterized protein n=1 Tax=Echinostoma caproni TaxID=27848 RepID=A0A183A8N6_9TREM|nr:unnamed protein product [Echinostoma caproni]